MLHTMILASLPFLSTCGGVDPTDNTPLPSFQPESSLTTDETDDRETVPPLLCVFDYDLTLSSHACAQTEDNPAYHCRTNECGTYSWNDQCLGVAARDAVAVCVERGAAIGIASHADADKCWADKVVPIVKENQFPELLASAADDGENAAVAYPAIDNRDNWNCETCAYQMNPSLSKPDGIARIMRHYGMTPDSPEHRVRVIFFDDSPSNVAAVREAMPGARVIPIPRNGDKGGEGGCGITAAEIEAAFGDEESAP